MSNAATTGASATHQSSRDMRGRLKAGRVVLGVRIQGRGRHSGVPFRWPGRSSSGEG
jgi:hypothetical protein